MNSDLKMKLLTEICERNPNTRLNSALWQVAKREKLVKLKQESRAAQRPLIMSAWSRLLRSIV